MTGAINGRVAGTRASSSAQASLTPSAIADIRCAARSGIGTDAAATLGLLATIDEMGRTLATQGLRYADELDRLRQELEAEAAHRQRYVVAEVEQLGGRA